jgi:hypothetical protein
MTSVTNSIAAEYISDIAVGKLDAEDGQLSSSRMNLWLVTPIASAPASDTCWMQAEKLQC